MKDSLNLKAMLIPVGRDFSARAGDRLIVVAGICIGVYTGEEGIPVAPPTAKPPREDKPPKQAKEIRKEWDSKYRDTRNSRIANGTYEPVSTVVPVVAAIRKLFEKRSEYSSAELKRLVENAGPKEWRLRDAIGYLVYKKEIVPINHHHNRAYVRKDTKEAAA